MAKKKKLEPPSEDQIGKLLPWAQVAFAARCARRVQPLAEEKELIEAHRKGTRMLYSRRMGVCLGLSGRCIGCFHGQKC